MKTTLTINLEWWRTDGKPTPIGHSEDLKAAGLERAKELYCCGFVRGELQETFPNGVHYRGWWSIVESTEE